jgi:hypothetical protein
VTTYRIQLHNGATVLFHDLPGQIEALIIERGRDISPTILGSSVRLNREDIQEIQDSHPHLLVYAQEIFPCEDAL